MPQQPPPAQQDRIQGRVIDSGTKLPLSGAILIAGLADGSTIQLTADAAGHFEIDRPLKDVRRLSVNIPGYESVMVSVTSGFTEIPVTHHQEVTGILIDVGSKKPLPKVSISLLPADQVANPIVEMPGHDSNSATTGDDGSFKIGDFRGNDDFVLRIEAGAHPRIVPIPIDQAKSAELEAKREASEATGFTTLFWPGHGFRPGSFGKSTFQKACRLD